MAKSRKLAALLTTLLPILPQALNSTAFSQGDSNAFYVNSYLQTTQNITINFARPLTTEKTHRTATASDTKTNGYSRETEDIKL